MTEFKTIVHHNDLIDASYRLEIDELRLINLALMKIDSRKANIGVIEIYPEEFANLYNLNKKNIWRNMKKSLVSIMTKPVKIRFVDSLGKKQEKVVSWLGSTTYFVNQSDGAKIELEFTTQIAPYLFELENKFTKLNFESAGKLTTSFSFRLYQWLVREHEIKRTHKKLVNGVCELTMTIDEIKTYAHLDGLTGYNLFGNFKRIVIQPAIDAINARTNLSVTYKTEKKGRSVHSITFTYIDEYKNLEGGGEIELKDKKPTRPRLQRRPKVLKGSHNEGEWMKANLKLMKRYREDLHAWDSTARMSIADIERMAAYSKIFDESLHLKLLAELKTRKIKRT